MRPGHFWACELGDADGQGSPILHTFTKKNEYAAPYCPFPHTCPTARRGPLPAPTPARQCGVAPPSSHACPTAQRAPSCGRSDQHTNELCCCRYFTLSSGVKVRGDAGECLLLLRRYYHRVPEDAQGLTFKRQEPKKGELFVVNSCELCGQAASYQPSQHPPVHCIAQPPAAHFIT